MDKSFLPTTYKQQLYIRVTLVQQGNMKVEEYIRGFDNSKLGAAWEENLSRLLPGFLKGQILSF